MRRFFQISIAILLLAAASFVAVELWGGASRSATSILRSGDRVESFRVSPKTVGDGVPNTICGYPILSTGREQGSEFAQRLGNVVRSWAVAPTSKKCMFEPGIVFRVWNGDRAVEILVCFKCDDLYPHVLGENPTIGPGVLAFDARRADLVALAKEAFPDDIEIQAIPAVRSDDSDFLPAPPKK